MKETYFTAGNIDEKARGLLHSLEHITRGRGIRFVPDSAALLILDMQGYFLDERSHAFIPSSAPVLQRIKRLSGAFRARGLPVIFTRHLNTEDDAGAMKTWWSDLITEGSELSGISGELLFDDSPVVRKTRYDAFHGTRLEGMLRASDVSRLVVTGVMTHLCCETTARSAFMRGFTVFFPVDGTATYNEEFHRAALLNLSHGFAVPVLVADLLESLGEVCDA